MDQIFCSDAVPPVLIYLMVDSNLTLTYVWLGPIKKFMGRHLEIGSILYVLDISCIKDCMSPELACKSACNHVCARDIPKFTILESELFRSAIVHAELTMRI